MAGQRLHHAPPTPRPTSTQASIGRAIALSLILLFGTVASAQTTYTFGVSLINDTTDTLDYFAVGPVGVQPQNMLSADQPPGTASFYWFSAVTWLAGRTDIVGDYAVAVRRVGDAAVTQSTFSITLIMVSENIIHPQPWETVSQRTASISATETLAPNSRVWEVRARIKNDTPWRMDYCGLGPVGTVPANQINQAAGTIPYFDPGVHSDFVFDALQPPVSYAAPPSALAGQYALRVGWSQTGQFLDTVVTLTEAMVYMSWGTPFWSFASIFVTYDGSQTTVTTAVTNAPPQPIPASGGGKSDGDSKDDGCVARAGDANVWALLLVIVLMGVAAISNRRTTTTTRNPRLVAKLSCVLVFGLLLASCGGGGGNGTGPLPGDMDHSNFSPPFKVVGNSVDGPLPGRDEYEKQKRVSDDHVISWVASFVEQNGDKTLREVRYADGAPDKWREKAELKEIKVSTGEVRERYWVVRDTVPLSMLDLDDVRMNGLSYKQGSGIVECTFSGFFWSPKTSDGGQVVQDAALYADTGLVVFWDEAKKQFRFKNGLLTE